MPLSVDLFDGNMNARTRGCGGRMRWNTLSRRRALYHLLLCVGHQHTLQEAFLRALEPRTLPPAAPAPRDLYNLKSLRRCGKNAAGRSPPLPVVATALVHALPIHTRASGTRLSKSKSSVACTTHILAAALHYLNTSPHLTSLSAKPAFVAGTGRRANVKNGFTVRRSGALKKAYMTPFCVV